jgi:hypothetical protein
MFSLSAGMGAIFTVAGNVKNWSEFFLQQQSLAH